MQAMTSSLEVRAEKAEKFGSNMNVVKAKIMAVGNWTISAKIKVGNEVFQEYEEFYYLCSTISKDGQ